MMEMESINGLVGGFPGFMLYSDLPSVWILRITCHIIESTARMVTARRAEALASIAV
jgi:hypothetical protein